jgi:cell division protein FtsB
MSSPHGSPSPSALQKKPLWPFLLIVLLLGLALFGDKGILRAIQFNRQKAGLQAELQRMEEANYALRQEIESLRSDRRYIEDIARRELGMVKADELVYQFPTQGERNGSGETR